MRGGLACAILALLVAPATGGAGTGDDGWDEFRALYAMLERWDLAGVPVSTQDAPLALDQTLTVTVDWTRDTLPAMPTGSPLPAAGCITPGGLGDVVPWAVPGTDLGPCPHPGARFTWGLYETTMTCVWVGSYCFTDGMNGLPASNPGAFVITCRAPQLAAGSWLLGAPWSLPPAQCGVFAFGAPPPEWSSWDSICAYGFGDPGVYACGHAGA